MNSMDAIHRAPRCGASTRQRTACRNPAMRNGRCRMHGGMSTGPRTPEGLERSRRARWNTGRIRRKRRPSSAKVAGNGGRCWRYALELRIGSQVANAATKGSSASAEPIWAEPERTAIEQGIQP
jgi:hypothetical protein